MSNDDDGFTYKGSYDPEDPNEPGIHPLRLMAAFHLMGHAVETMLDVPLKKTLDELEDEDDPRRDILECMLGGIESFRAYTENVGATLTPEVRQERGISERATGLDYVMNLATVQFMRAFVQQRAEKTIEQAAEENVRAHFAQMNPKDFN